ncbi:MAG: tetratricopeptide repeat protein [Bacteriovoracaceae bacterium]
MTKAIFLSLVLLSSTACIKTAEQVQREKNLENMSQQVKDSQGLMADMVDQIKDMQAQLDRMNGRIEELEHNQKQMTPENLKQLHESLALMKSQEEAQAAQLVQIQNELKEQRAFLEKVTQTLSSVEHAPAKSNGASKKKSKKDELTDALQLVSQNHYEQARTELEALIDNPELTPGDHNKVLHGLGRVEYHTKNYDKALVYFSKIFTKYPKASLAPSSLLYIGRSLKRLGKKEEAKEAFLQVSSDYPDTKEAKDAKKEL